MPEIPTRLATRRRPSVPRSRTGGGDPPNAPDGRPRRGRRVLRRLVEMLVLAALIAAVAIAVDVFGLPGTGWLTGPDTGPAPVPAPGLTSGPRVGADGESAASVAAPAESVFPVPPAPPLPDAAPAAGRAALGRPAGVPGAVRPAAPEPAAPPLPPPVATRQEPQELPAAATEPDPVAPPGTAAGSGGIRVFIHHAASDRTSAALAAQLSDRLRREGYPTVVTRQVRFRVTAPGVRFFFPADREAAGRLLSAAARFVTPRRGQAPAAPADFTHIAPKPRVGTLEVWIPSG